MKKIYLLIAAVFLSAASIMAQAPAKMSYQATIRNSSDFLVSNSTIGMRISILEGSASGTTVYAEIQVPTSNANGLVSIEIGEGTVESGDFSAIDWANGPYFIKTETDPTGGTNYTITGVSQLLSVPYALYAKTSGSSIPGPQGPAGTDGESAYEIAVNNGFPGTEEEWLESLQGPQGEAGISGQGVPTGGTAGQVLSKVDGTDYNTAWVTPASGGGARLQLFATSTTPQAKNPYAYNRYTFNFNNVVSGENSASWTNNNTYTLPAGMGGLYSINLTIVETYYGSFVSPVLVYPEIQITSGTNVIYYYGSSGNGSVLLQGNDTDGSAIGATGAPTPFVRGSGNFMIPLQEGDKIKVFYRAGSSSNCPGCTISFSTDGSTYLSIVKMD